MEEVRWTVGSRQAGAEPKRKAKYAPIQKTNDKMTKGQLAGVNQWNEMVTILRENGLMEEEQGGS